MIKIIKIIFILCIFANANIANATSCSDYNDNPTNCEAAGCVYYETISSCAPCDLNQYRNTTTTPYTCATCDNGPTDQNGKACGETGSLCQYTGSNGDSPNCKWTMTCQNITTENGTWVPTSSTVSGTGSDSTCEWKMTCTTQNIDNGTWAPDATPLTYRATDSEKPKCEYNNTSNITCSSTGGRCAQGYGFHREDDYCVDNVKECSGGLQFYISGGFVCYKSSCDSGFTLVPLKYCDSAPYGTECMTNVIPCNTAPGLNTTTCNGDGTISGNASLNGTTYDFSTCTCEKELTVANGTAIETCYFSGDGSSLSTRCFQKLRTCDKGYCDDSTGACVAANDTQYSEDTSTSCESCPAGATTSKSASISKYDCHYTSRTTFTDSAGSFKIPSDNIAIKRNWQ